MFGLLAPRPFGLGVFLPGCGTLRPAAGNRRCYQPRALPSHNEASSHGSSRNYAVPRKPNSALTALIQAPWRLFNGDRFSDPGQTAAVRPTGHCGSERCIATHRPEEQSFRDRSVILTAYRETCCCRGCLLSGWVQSFPQLCRQLEFEQAEHGQRRDAEQQGEADQDPGLAQPRLQVVPMVAAMLPTTTDARIGSMGSEQAVTA